MRQGRLIDFKSAHSCLKVWEFGSHQKLNTKNLICIDNCLKEHTLLLRLDGFLISRLNDKGNNIISFQSW
jgi:hypothetical protein